MKNLNFKNILIPAIWFIVAMIVLSLIMEQGHKIGLPTSVQSFAAMVYGGIMNFSPIILFAIAFFRKYSPAEQVLAALLPVFFWWIAEVAMRVGQGHSIPEAVYLTFFLVNLFYYVGFLFSLSVTAIICRTIAKKRKGWDIKIFTKGIWLVLGAFLLIQGSIPFWAGNYFGGFQKGYRNLFMGETFEPYLDKLDKREMGAIKVQLKDTLTQQPNIVVVLSDDHRWDYMSNMGHPFVKTPNMDKLFAQGVRFNNAFVNSSLCSPSRASFLTGQYPQQHGVFNNFTPWINKNQTFFEYFKKAGYATAFIGKWHMPGGLPELRGVDEFATFTVIGGQGKYWNCPLIVNGKEEPSKKPYIAEELTDRSIDFINQNKDKPFVLYLSHKSVHSPFSPDEEEAGDYQAQDIQLPDGSHNYSSLTNGHYVHFMFDKLDKTMKNYGEAVTSMDRQMGRVIDKIDDLGLKENTVFIYVSDNGQVWGEHKEIDKRSATEESIRVPWIMRYPKLIPQGGKEVEEMVLNVDLFPTLLDLAGIQTPASVQGKSMAALFQINGKADWRKDFYYNYYFEPPYTVQTVHTVRTDRYKYNEYDVKGPELFDLQNDPKEYINLYNQDGFERIGKELKSRLEALKKEVAE